MRTLPSSAKPEKTSTFSSKWVGSATGITKDKARPAREGEWFDGKITDTKCRGCLCRPVFHPVFEVLASGQRTQRHAATIEVSASVILRVHDHERGAVASKRNGQ